jgi:hypothetical protein
MADRRTRMHGKRRHPSWEKSPFKAETQYDGGESGNVELAGDKKQQLINEARNMVRNTANKFAASNAEKKNRNKRRWDRVQTGLSFLGTVIPLADGLNAAVSLGRMKHAQNTGDLEAANKHKNAAIWNTAAIIPGVGELKKTHKGAASVLQGIKSGGKLGYDFSTGAQVVKDMTGGYNIDKTKIL